MLESQQITTPEAIGVLASFDNRGRIIVQQPLDVNTSAYSMSVWFKLDTLELPSDGDIGFTVFSDASTNVTGKYGGWIMIYPTGELMITAYRDRVWNNDNVPGVIIEANKWYHIVLVADKFGQTKAYLDNQLILNRATPQEGITNGVTLLGDLREGRNIYFKGKMKNFLLFNKLLNESEINDLYLNKIPMNDSSLKVHWSLKEGRGNSAFDLSGNNNHGSLNEFMSWQTNR